MSDNWNDQTVPRQPAEPPFPAQPPSAPPPGGPVSAGGPGSADGAEPVGDAWPAGGAPSPAGGVPPSDATPPTGVSRGPVDESAWVRSVYLFGACATGGVLMIIGLLLAVGSLVSVVSPDSGLRDGWDRGLVGATEVVDQGLDVFEEFERMQLEDDFDRFCDEDTDDSFCDDLADRVDDGESAIPEELTDSVGLIRDEVHRQIRVAAIAKLFGGLVLAAIGFLVFRFHSKQVTVYSGA